jgi:hypothetical protein
MREMPAARKRDIAIRVMVNKTEQAELRRAADKAALPLSVYVRSIALGVVRKEAGDDRGKTPPLNRRGQGATGG